jgi:nitrite reductase (NADH) small subunit/3-phenylpropionate/trans-cinnamate dioxygenase ferredoxin subunit
MKSGHRRPQAEVCPLFSRSVRSRLVSQQTFHAVARVGEIPEGQGRAFEIEGRMIAVFQDGGQYYAIDDTCPHQGAPLADGIVFDRTVTCTWHGWRFSLEDGCWLDSRKSKIRVGTYPVRVVGDEIQVAVE